MNTYVKDWDGDSTFLEKSTVSPGWCEPGIWQTGNITPELQVETIWVHWADSYRYMGHVSYLYRILIVVILDVWTAVDLEQTMCIRIGG